MNIRKLEKFPTGSYSYANLDKGFSISIKLNINQLEIEFYTGCHRIKYLYLNIRKDEIYISEILGSGKKRSGLGTVLVNLAIEILQSCIDGDVKVMGTSARGADQSIDGCKARYYFWKYFGFKFKEEFNAQLARDYSFEVALNELEHRTINDKYYPLVLFSAFEKLTA